ncbi:MAG: IS5 family transposase [Dehalobacterium sp.]|jgi:IS5 family transposase
MYKPTDKLQFTFLDFNQPMGLRMNPNNRWIKMADCIPWDVFEEKYAKLFPSSTGNVAKPLRLALGALIIQTKYQFSDRELVDQLAENPYYQYFIGLPGYQQEPPIEASVLVLFRKRIDMGMIMEANEYMLSDNRKDDDNQPPSGTSGSVEVKEGAAEPGNEGTMMLDATCAPSNIRYPQDYSLLNEAREKLENIIDRFSKSYGFKKPRTYRREARKNYLALAKCKKRSTKKIRKTIRKQLGYVNRDLGYLEQYMSEGYAPTSKEIRLLLTIRKLYEQQEYMYRNSTHSIANRIVSIAQPYLRPIVRGKIKSPVEFGAKFDLSIDSEGYGRIEKISFDAYNESTCLQEAVERFKERTGHYPERVLADQIYRNRANRAYCKLHGIRLSGPKLGRPTATAKTDKKIEYKDNTDRIEVERSFSLSKRCYGMGLIRTKLEETTLTSIALSVFVTNLFKIQARILSVLFLLFEILDANPAELNQNAA